MVTNRSAGLLYVGDPMCSWCWGFAPVLETLQNRLSLDVDIIVGGLRPGPAAVRLDDTMKRFLRREWTRIAEVTGQPFDHSTLDRDGWVYDTMMPAVAVAGMRSRVPERTLEFFTRIQRAFYAEAVDVTDPSVYGPLIGGLGIDDAVLLSFLTSEEGREAALQDFARAAEMGVQGFPTLLFRRGDGGLVLLSRGYAPIEQLEPVIKDLLSSELE